MKTLPTILLLFSLVTAILAQYGIPDEDEEPTARAPNPAFYVLPKYQSAPTSAPSKKAVTLPKATPAPVRYEKKVERVEPQYTAAPPAPSPVKISVTTGEVKSTEVKHTSGYDSSRSTPLRQSHPSNVNIPVHKIEFKDDSSSSLTYSAPSHVRVVSPPVIVRDSGSYTRQQSYSSEGGRNEAVPIVKYVLESDDTRGKFRLETVTGDGTTKHKSGYLKDLGGKEGPVQVMAGSYSFTGDDGKVYKVDWTADEGGFKASGAHLGNRR